MKCYLQGRFGSFLLLSLVACTAQSSISNHYLTAEKLWSEKNYPAAVSEFDRVVKESPNSALGLQSLWRASMTRALFLNQPEDALKGFESFLEKAANSELAPEAQIEIGEIYFSKLSQYQKTIDFYQKLLLDHQFQESDRSKFTYRIARSYFLTNRLNHAIPWYEKVMSNYPSSAFSNKAEFDLAHCWYALGEAEKQAYAKALHLFQDLKSKTDRKDPLMQVEAIFGEASTLEEMDELEEAYQLFKSIEKTYPAPNVIKIRMVRLEERKNKKRK